MKKTFSLLLAMVILISVFSFPITVGAIMNNTDPKFFSSVSVNGESDDEEALALGALLNDGYYYSTREKAVMDNGFRIDRLDELFVLFDEPGDYFQVNFSSNNKNLIKDEKAIAEEFKKKILNFFSDFNSLDKDHYHQVVGATKETINYNFITFNYTSVLDKIVAAAQKHCKPFGNHSAGGVGYNDTIVLPHHIHGKLTEDLILGLDNAEQILNDKLKTNPKLTNYIIKSVVNTALGEKKIEKARDIINKSKFICLFGLSIGDTDGMWWSYIIDWLKKSNDSIDRGFEIVSHPMSLDYHTDKMNWSEVFDKAVSMGYRSHQTDTCGLHIHVSRDAFGKTYEEQENAIGRIVFFVEKHWNEIVKFSRRTQDNLNR